MVHNLPKLRYTTKNHFSGKIGGVAVFDQALTEVEMTEMYALSFK